MEINKFILEIVLNDQAASGKCMAEQLQTPGNRHDLPPFCHVGRGDIDNVAVFVPVCNLKAVILEDGAALKEGRSGKGNVVFSL